MMSATVSTLGSALTGATEAGLERVGSLLSSDSSLQLVLISLGLSLALYLLACLLYHLVRGFYTFLLPSLVGLFRKPRIKERYGAWALVTGATMGIGKEYSLALAQAGLNIILVSRNKQELENTANEIRDKHKVDTLTVVADFTEVDGVTKVVKKVKSLNHEIGVLVNNVGMMGPGYVNITDMDKKSIKEMLTVNMFAVTLLCHALLPDMTGRGRGAVINISSVAGLIPLPYLAVYTATQHYISAFTQAIAQELSGSGVVIQEVDPGQVDGARTNNLLPLFSSLLAPTSANFVASSLRTLGYNDRTCGYWSHSLGMTLLQSMIPSCLCSLIISCCSKAQLRFAQKQKTPPVAAPVPPPPSGAEKK